MKVLEFKTKIDTSEADKKVDDLNKKLEQTGELTELDLVIKNANAVKSVKELNEAMEQLQNQALKFEQGSDEFIKAATKAGELKKRIDDINKSIDVVAQGGQLGSITNSFDRLKQSAMTFDIEGLRTNFGLLRTQIAGAATAALGLGQGFNVATIAARGLAVALAATGITLVIAAVAILISEFDNLASSGGLIGAVFTSIGDAVSFLRDNILELLDSLGLIDLEAKKAADAQAEYLRDLEDSFKANSDAYDELTKKKKEADLEYLKIVEETNKRTDIGERRKNELIILYNNKRIRAIKKAEEDEAKRLENVAKEQKAKDKQLAAEKEARELGFIKVAAEKRLDAIKKASLEEIVATYEAYNEGRILEQQVVDKNIDIRLDATEKSIKSQQKLIKDLREQGYKEESDEVRKSEADLLQLRLDLVGQFAAIRTKKEAELAQEAQEFIKFETMKREAINSFEYLNFISDVRLSEEAALYDEFNIKLFKLNEARNAGLITGEVQHSELVLRLYDEYQRKRIQVQETYAYEEALIDQRRAQDNIKRLEDERRNLEASTQAQLKVLNKRYDEEAAAAKQVMDGKLEALYFLGQNERISEEEYITRKKAIEDEYLNAVKSTFEQIQKAQKVYQTEALKSDKELIDAKIELQNAEKQVIIEAADLEISEAQRVTDERIRQFNEVANVIQNIGGFISQSVNQISDIMSGVHEKRLFEIEEEYTAQYNSLQAQLKAGLITEQQLSVGLAKIEEKRRRAKYNADKKAFEQEKAIRITQAVMSTIQASLAAYSSGAAIPVIGTVMGPVFAAIAAAFGAVQVGMIASEKFPSYQQSSATVPNISSGGGGGGAGLGAASSTAVPPSFFANAGAVQGTDAMLNPGGIYQVGGAGGMGQVWVLESDITGLQSQVAVTEDRSYFDSGSFG
jgi:hypothetical protein